MDANGIGSLNLMITDISKSLNFQRHHKLWLGQSGARALGVRYSGRDSYTLADASVDSEKSDEEQALATTLLLLEDALVHGVQLTAKGRMSKD